MKRARTLTHGEQQAIWKRFRAGESLREIARGLERNPSSVVDLVRRRGGIAPPPDTRSARSLSLADREAISRGLAAGHSYREIARSLERAASTVSREVARHGGRRRYRAVLADERAWRWARRPKLCKLALLPELRHAVSAGLYKDFSPKQIASSLKLAFPNQPDMHVSHETIYRSLFIQARGVLRKELAAHLRSQRTYRRAKAAAQVPAGRGQIKNAVSIRERPAEAEDRAVPGHWEGDLLCGAENSYVATLVERHSRFVMLVKVDNKTTATVVRALTQKIKKLPMALKRSLTWDRGMEMADHAKFTVATKVNVYFCDPRSPWQRGSNENTNGLLRQYLPRTSILSDLTQAELDKIAHRLNIRPRETLGFRTPAFTLQQAMQ